jgi:hypothetical protein
VYHTGLGDLSIDLAENERPYSAENIKIGHIYGWQSGLMEADAFLLRRSMEFISPMKVLLYRLELDESVTVIWKQM